MNTFLLSHPLEYFKFQAQHLFKLVAVISEKPELKGTKALDIFSRIAGHKNFNEARLHLNRLAKHGTHTYKINLKRRSIIEELQSIGLTESQSQRTIKLFYREDKDWYFDQATRDALITSLRKLTCLSHMPYKAHTNFSDNLAVDLFTLGEITSNQRWHILSRNQLVGIIMLLSLLLDRDFIVSFDFQDIIDCLEPNNYKRLSMLYSSQLRDDLQHCRPSTDVIAHCFDKVLDNFTRVDLETSHSRYQTFLSYISGKRLHDSHDKFCIIDCIALKLIDVKPEGMSRTQTISVRHLVDKGFLTNPDSLDENEAPISLKRRITDKGKQYLNRTV